MKKFIFPVVVVAALLLGAVAAPAAAAATSTEPTRHPGATNSIVDVPGLKVGQYQRSDDGFLTGTSVVYAPHGATAGVSVSGGAPGTRETALLKPMNRVQAVNAIVLSGGSSYGLVSAYGVMRWLREHNEGFRVGKKKGHVVPIVPGAIIFDLGRGGEFAATPTRKFGYRAIDTASGKHMTEGTVGAGTGAFSGTLKGGVGTASVVLPGGYVVGAVVVVNSVGRTTDPATCRFYAGALELGNEFALEPGKIAACGELEDADDTPDPESMNTTIAVVATNAPLDKAMATRMALMAQDGLAIAIRPIHTLYDGDTVFALATGQGEPLSPKTDTRQLTRVFVAGVNTLARAVVHAMVQAESVPGRTSYCDRYEGVCQ